MSFIVKKDDTDLIAVKYFTYIKTVTVNNKIHTSEC